MLSCWYRNFLTSFFIILCLSSPGSALGYPIRVLGGDEASFTPLLSKTPIPRRKSYDVIIVGAGIAGLTSAVFLTDRGKSVLIIEKEENLGGIAAGGSVTRTHYNRGTAYFTNAYEEEHKILERIDFADYREKYPIPEPIDSYLWNGKLYLGLWEHQEALETLPASFELFKHELEITFETGLVPNQPFEEFDCYAVDEKVAQARKSQNLTQPDCMALDEISAASWIRQMPLRNTQRTDERSRKIRQRYFKELSEGKLSQRDPMRDVINFLDLYSRSALGGTTDRVSAMAFANFYISEIETRFTTMTGTNKAVEKMQRILEARPKLAEIITSAAVGRVKSAKDAVRVVYLNGGKTYEAKAQYAVFAAQAKIGPKLIEGLSELSPQKAEMMKSLPYSHYSVHAVSVKGHPFRATYDTWVRASDYTDDDFTDVILGRWMDPKIKAYEGMRDFSSDPKDDRGIFSIYHPLGDKWIGQGYGIEQAKEFARRATERMIEIFSPLLMKTWGTRIDVISVETSRWPFSVHVAEPGHFKHKAKVLRKPHGRVYFAHSNLGTPAFEEALFRGHCAANNILKKVDPAFEQESWTHCPLELD